MAIHLKPRTDITAFKIVKLFWCLGRAGSPSRHPQTLLATHQNGQPLTVEHGAPLRLLAPMKIGLKNIKAITQISYTVEEPTDYWGIRGYSKYQGI
jgi:DMSO/TMAO reductase YedYZ molybdopterin-dependent catalytic subunit